MAIRVLRLMEYTYPNVEQMAQDMAKWAVQREYYVHETRMRIRSTTLPLEVFDEEPSDD